MALPAANLTDLKVRRQDATGVYMRRYQVDPYWGIPEGQPPLLMDPTTGLVRPFSSCTTVAFAADNFVGFCNEWVPPGEERSVWVVQKGWVEFKLETPAAVKAGDIYKPIVVSGAVSDDTVNPVETLYGIFKAVYDCPCQPSYDRATCLGAVPAANNTSPTSATRNTVRTAVFLFDAA